MIFTTARLIAAVFLAVTGWLVSLQIRPLMPESTAFGYFNYVNAGLGLAVGWVVIGSRLGRGISNAIGVGVTAAVSLLFWGLFLQASREMFALANKRRYDGPMEAIIGVFEIGVEYGTIAATPTVMAVLFGGGIVTAVLAERAAQVWR